MEIDEPLRGIAQILPSMPSTRPVSMGGGCIHSAWRWGPYFIKTNSREHQSAFRAEAAALELIASTETIRVPEVVTRGATEISAFLVLEHLDLTLSGDEALLGEQLAALHQHEADQFGYSEDNFIGSTPQPNRWTDDWPTFFREQRLGHLFGLLERKGIKLPGADRLLARLQDLLPANPRPSLLHGDLWGGNKAFLKDGTPVIFDAACFHGHAACDLAMTNLFGGFGRRFYDAYRNSSGLDDPSLHELYNLYHVLNHALMFESDYLAEASHIIRRHA